MIPVAAQSLGLLFYNVENKAVVKKSGSFGFMRVKLSLFLFCLIIYQS